MLARRFGPANKGVAIACLVFVVLFGAVGFVRMRGTPAITIDRAEAGAPERESASTHNTATNVQEEGGGDQRAPGADDQEPQQAYVHVDGAVASPGVYCVQGTSPRVNDAVQLAGGLTAEADTASLNLAAPLADGQKVHVPLVGESPLEAEAADGDASESSTGQAMGSEPSTVNINTANEEELQRLPGVGEATAVAIVRDREQNGSFSSPDDIMRVSGIGEKKFEKMREMICV